SSDLDRVPGPVALGARLRRDREARAHHLGVVNAAPEVAAVGHVAVLALDALAREAIRLPLVVRVLEELAAEREAVPAELVAAAAELRGEICGRARHAPVRQRLARRGAGERPVAAREGRGRTPPAPATPRGARSARAAAPAAPAVPASDAPGRSPRAPDPRATSLRRSRRGRAPARARGATACLHHSRAATIPAWT